MLEWRVASFFTLIKIIEYEKLFCWKGQHNYDANAFKSWENLDWEKYPNDKSRQVSNLVFKKN